jgi:ribonuclease P protein component
VRSVPSNSRPYVGDTAATGFRDRAGYERDLSLQRAVVFVWVHTQACTPVGDCHTTRRYSRGQGQADLPAEQPAPGAGSWLPSAHAHPRWARDRDGPAPQGSSFTDCLILGSRGVLPAQFRMTRSAEFGATIKHGVRAAQPDIVVHARRDAESDDGPRIGLVVAKSVGNAVQRHQVSRRLRHVARTVLPDLTADERVVIRALPTSSRAVSARLEQQLRAGLRRTHDLMEKAR